MNKAQLSLRECADACLYLRIQAHRYLRIGDMRNFRRCIGEAHFGWRHVNRRWRYVFERENVDA